MAKPPVCKIMDYGKFKYEAKKKANEAKKKQTIVKLKEVKFRPKTEEHDYNFKVKAIREFLGEGNKARVTVMFRGREITHREIGQAILNRISTELKEVAVVEQTARLEGRLLFMILAPNPRWLQKQQSAQGAAAQQPAAAVPRPAPAPANSAAAAAPRPQAPARPSGPPPPQNGAPRGPAAPSPAVQRAEAPKS